jgi:flagellar basal-body rod protein FlgC
METIATNIANAETTRAEDGLPYRKRSVRIKENTVQRTSSVSIPRPTLKLQTRSARHLSAGTSGATRAVVREEPSMEAEIVEAPPGRVKYVYDPHHPDANPEGYVAYPDINPVEEMVDMMEATRAYEANIASMDAFKSMIKKALEI